jgi:hypothetical protein
MSLLNYIKRLLVQLQTDRRIAFLCLYYPRISAISCCCVAILASLLLGNVYLDSCRQENAQILDNITRLEQQIKNLTTKRDPNLPTTDLTQLKLEADNNKQLWPRIYALAKQYQVQVINIQSLEHTDFATLKCQTLKLRITASYHNLGLFLQAIANLPPSAVILWQDLEITRSDTPFLLEINMHWQIYTL